MKTQRLFGVATACVLIACTLGLSACGTLTGAPAGAAGSNDLLEAVRSITANCSGAFNANLTFAPPLPPSGSLVVNQTCAAAGPAASKPASTPST